MLINEMKKVLLRNDPAEMVTWFSKRTEAERSTLAKPTDQFISDLSWNWRVDRSVDRRLTAEIEELGFEKRGGPRRHDEGHPSYEVALLATQPASLLKELAFDLSTEDKKRQKEWDVALIQILKDRKLKSIDAVVESLLASNEREAGGTISPEFLLMLIEAGATKQPDSANYLQCLTGLLDKGWSEPGRIKLHRNLMLRNDAFLKRDAYRLLQFESDIFFNTEKEEWSTLISQLSRSGHLDRAQVVQAVVRGLFADFKQNVLRGMVKFFEKLKTKPDEVAVLAKDFSGLLGSKQSAVGKFAFGQLKSLHDAKTIDDETLLALLPPVFDCPTKGLPKNAITLISKIARSSKNAIPLCVESIMHALSHSDAEVQAAALKWLSGVKERLHGDHFGAIRGVIGTLAATNRKAAAALAGEPEPTPTAATPVAAGTVEPTAGAEDNQSEPAPHAFGSLDAVTPIANHEELIDEIARTIEITETGLEAERIFDAISRLGPVPESLSDRATPLLARLIEQSAWPNSRADAGSRSLCKAPDATPRVHRVLCLALGMKELMLPARTDYDQDDAKTFDLDWPPEPTPMRLPSYESDSFKSSDGPGGAYRALNYAWRSRLLWQRMEAIENRLQAGFCLPLLASPTHQHGWIEPSVLVDRLLQWQSESQAPDESDLILALMRLSPQGRENARKQAAKIKSPLTSVLMLALDKNPSHVPADPATDHALLNVAAHVRRVPIAPKEISRLNLDENYVCGGSPIVFDWRLNEKKTAALIKHYDWKEPMLVIDRRPCEWIDAHRSLSEIYRLNCRDLSTTSVWKTQIDAWNDPVAQDAFWMEALTRMTELLNKGPSNASPNHAFLETLFDPTKQWTIAACGVVTLSLAGKNTDQSSIAVDALCEAISQGRISAEIMAEGMNRIFVSTLVQSKRFAGNYQHVANASPQQCSFVADTLGRLIHFWCDSDSPLAEFQFDRFAKATDSSPVLDLYAECLAELGSKPAAAQRTAFAAVSAKGKVGKSLKALSQSQ